MGHVSIFPSPEVIEAQKKFENERINKAEAEFIAFAEYHKKRIVMLSDGFVDMANVCQKHLKVLKEVLSEDFKA